MKTTYWTRLSVVCVVALVSVWHASNVPAAASESILGLGGVGPIGGPLQPIPPLGTLGPKPGPSFQLDPKFQLNNSLLGKNNLQINPNLAGKLKPLPNGSGSTPPTSKNWWDTPFGQAVAGGVHDYIAGYGNYQPWPGPGYYGANSGANSGAYYDYGASYASPSYNMPPANVLPSAPMRLAIENPSSTGVAIQFMVDGRTGNLAPGQRAEIGQFSPKVVEFHRGGQFGVARYGLEEGVYTFAVTPQGIELYHGAYTPASALAQ